MLKRVRYILAGFALLLGIAHMGFGVIAHQTFSLALLWFLSAGIAMIVTALANFNDNTRWILRTQNALMLGFIIALAWRVPQPQIWLGVFLFTGLLILSFSKMRSDS